VSIANPPPFFRGLAEVPLLPPSAAHELGPVLVVAPHPDDEVLGCGGVIGLLRQAQVPVYVAVVSDGGGSHPGSARYPPAALSALRQAESLTGLAHLGVHAAQVTFLGLPDGAVPSATSAAGQAGIDGIRRVLEAAPGVRTVLLPWRRDPHADHRAAWSLGAAALDALGRPLRRLEYPIWTLVHPQPDDSPRPDEARLWRLDIGPVTALKRAAILAHVSQTTDLITDATWTYCLTDDVLAHFAQPWELLIEAGASDA